MLVISGWVALGFIGATALALSIAVAYWVGLDHGRTEANDRWRHYSMWPGNAQKVLNRLTQQLTLYQGKFAMVKRENNALRKQINNQLKGENR